VPTVRQDLAAAVHRLGVLLGERPTALYAELRETKPIPQPPKEILVGLPTELLRQRPDIRAAERRLAAQTAQIGVATADLYPRFSLTGFFAFENFGVSDVFKWQNRAYGLGPTMQWNVFDGGRIRSNIQAQDAITQQLLTSYEQTVLDALRQVEDAMAFYIQENDRQDALYRSVVAAAKSVKLVQTLYVTGLTDFQNVQDQERRKSEQDDQYAQSQGAVTKYLVDIYRSLGGGWAPTDQQPTTTGAEAPKSDKGTTASTPAPQANEGIVHVSADASRDAPRRR
jgi:outer membrane protein TolC